MVKGERVLKLLHETLMTKISEIFTMGGGGDGAKSPCVKEGKPVILRK